MKSVVKKEKIVGGLLAGSRARKKGADISGKSSRTNYRSPYPRSCINDVTPSGVWVNVRLCCDDNIQRNPK